MLFEVVKTFESYLIDFNLIQLERGEDIHGKVVGIYSHFTENESLFGKGPRPRQPKIAGQPYNFEWTGGLFDGFRLEIKDNTAIFTSRDSKTPLLQEQYGDIFGLQPEHLREAIQEKIGPAFIKAIRLRLKV